MRKFRAKVPTKLKVQPDDSSTLDKGDYLTYNVGDVVEVHDQIEASKSGHLVVDVPLFMFGDHWEEIHPNPNKELVTFEQAQAIYGRTPTKTQLADLNTCLNRFEINRPNRIRHFLSQTAHESGGLKWVKELASGSAYEGRADLGNVIAGDGKRFKGAGVIQLTGRDNYQAFSIYIDDPKVMQGCDYVAKTYPFTSAGFWWKRNNMNGLCDRNPTVEQVTRRVNGGLNGLSDRKKYYAIAQRVIR